MRFLVTGSKGFIGRHLVWHLNEKGHLCALIDLEEGVDITNYEQMDEIFRLFKPDVVYHLAAQVNAAKSEEDPELDWRVNVLGSLNIMNLMYKYGVHVGVFVSTQAVQEPTSNYAVSKLAMEEYVKKNTRQGRFKGKIARISSCYGPDRFKYEEKQPIFIGPVNRFIYQCMTDEPITIYGEGTQLRDYIEVTDAVRALEIVREHGVIGETYNVGTGVQYRVSEVATVAKAVTGKHDIEIKYEPESGLVDYKGGPFDVTETFKLGFVPRYDQYMGMSNTFGNMRRIMKGNIEKKVKIIEFEDLPPE